IHFRRLTRGVLRRAAPTRAVPASTCRRATRRRWVSLTRRTPQDREQAPTARARPTRLTRRRQAAQLARAALRAKPRPSPAKRAEAAAHSSERRQLRARACPWERSLRFWESLSAADELASAPDR